jgi:hypothetical protein
MDIEKWLRGLGLQQYAAAFRDNAIDAEILPDLTDADLEKLGVVLGHRKQLLKAITAFVQAAPVGPAPSHGEGAECRQMFCRSRRLTEGFDTPDLREAKALLIELRK